MALTKPKYNNYSDAELIVKYQSNSDNAIIGELYIRYGHLVMGSCLNYLKEPEEAEDTTMEIFETLGEKLVKHEITYFKSWLYTLTRNECLMKLRKKGLDTTSLEDKQISDENTLEEKQLEEIKLSQLESAIEELKPPQDEVIKLFYIKELTYKEISELLNMTLKMVKSAIQNGKRNLKIKLEQHDLFKSA